MTAVDIDAIVRTSGVLVARNHGPDVLVSSFTYRDAGRRIVGVNTACSPRRQRWAIAHGYAHLQRHDRPLLVCYWLRLDRPDTPTVPSLSWEGEADRYAADVLLPRTELASALGREMKAGRPSRDALIGALAAEFEVSREAVGWRLLDLNMAMG